jgi:hypothetical protein
MMPAKVNSWSKFEVDASTNKPAAKPDDSWNPSFKQHFGDSSEMTCFFKRSKPVMWFSFIRGVTPHPNIMTKPLRAFTRRDNAALAYFILLNVFKLSCLAIYCGIRTWPLLMRIAQQANQHEEEDVSQKNNHVNGLYHLISFSITPILFMGKLASLYRLRHLLLKDEQVQVVTFEEIFSREQAWRYRFWQWSMLTVDLAIFIGALHRAYDVANDRRLIYTAVAILCYYEVAVEPDLLLLILYHVAQLYESLHRQLDCPAQWLPSTIETSSAGPTKERFNACADKWLRLRALCSEIGNAYTIYWIPFLAFVTSNLSFLLFQVSSNSSGPFWKLPPHRLYLILPAGVLVTILVCFCGQLVSDAVSCICWICLIKI